MFVEPDSIPSPIKSTQDSIYVYYISCLSLHHFRIETDRVIIISSQIDPNPCGLAPNSETREGEKREMEEKRKKKEKKEAFWEHLAMVQSSVRRIA